MKNQQGGFIQTILMIIIVLWLMNFFGLTLTGLLNYIRALFYGAV